VSEAHAQFERDYNERYAPTWTFERDSDGILVVRFHQQGPSGGQVDDRDRRGVPSLPTAERLWSQISHDDLNRVVILTGEGRVFSDSWQSTRPPGFYNPTMWSKALYSVPRSLDAFLDIPTILIAAVNGPASVHAEYLLLCDIVIAADTATFGDQPHFMNGHVPGDGVNVLWPLLLGWNRGRDFLLSGKSLSARYACDLGLVREVVPHDELLPRCREVAREMLRADQLTLRFTAMALRAQLKQLFHQFMPHSMALEGLAFVDQSMRAPDGD
jgi:enoyl-CoA hydratase/carnithine racemase